MNIDYLKEFEEMNQTTKSVFDSGYFGVLIILKDGTNLLHWVMWKILMIFYI